MGEDGEQAENGTGGQGATEGLLKSIERGWNLLDGRKEGENTDAKAFRRREVSVPVKSEEEEKQSRFSPTSSLAPVLSHRT